MFNPKLKVSVIAVSTMMALTSCGMAPPKVVYPDGAHTAPANQTDRIAALQTARERSRGMLMENEALRADIADMKKQMAEIRASAMEVLAQSVNAPGAIPQDTAPVIPQVTPAPPVWERQPHNDYTNPRPAAKRDPSQALPPHSAIEVMAVPRHVVLKQGDATNAAYFVKTFATGETQLTLDAADMEKIVVLAADARTIEIQGATDSFVADLPNRRVAYQRAKNARKLLVDAGIDASKIHTRSFASRYFAVPNDTAYGRSQNRRVQIILFWHDTARSAGV